jgi:pimeloyl-ACP methyl ester carboxylesterase
MRRIVAVIALAAGVLVLVAAGFVALAWAPDRPVSQLQARWAPPPSQFVNVSGMAVHLRDEGPRTGPSPIVLIHGTSSSLHTWEGWAEALRARRRVIRFDLPGFGLTGPAPGGDYTLPAYVRFVAALLDKLEVKRCVLAGNSFGGAVAWATALALPESVERLVLVDSAGYPLQATSNPGFRIAQMRGLTWAFDYVLPRSLIEASVRNVYGDPRKVTPELVDRYYEITLREGNRQALAQRFRQAPGGAMADRIRELRLPTLILWGGRDSLIPPVHAERFHGDIPGSQVIVFDGLGHVPHEEDPRRTVSALQRFLELN